jgi:hypothetical protein
MGLFKTLLDTSSSRVEAENAEKSSTTSALSLPSVVLLYTDQPLGFLGSSTPSFAHLSFQAVCTTAEESETSTVGLRVKQTVEFVPDLGVWNVRVSKRLSDSLMSIPSKSCSSYCWKVDMSNASSVEPTLTSLQDTLVRYLIQTSDTHVRSETPTTTTTLYQLRSVQFGLAAEDNDGKSVSAAPDENDRHIKISLQIVAVWPSSDPSLSDEDSFLRQQTTALLYYHLRRFAAALNATLVFVGKAESGVQRCLSIPQVARVLKAWAEGSCVWDSKVGTDVLEIQTFEENEEGNAFIYGPGMHNTEWIESVLLRNASYPGHWDANKESVWKILPAPLAGDTSNKRVVSMGTGDENWLQELRDSIALPVEAAATPRKPTTSASESKTPDVSDYFASLLKT